MSDRYDVKWRRPGDPEVLECHRQTLMTFTMIASVYVTVGYVIGIPLGALLDYFFYEPTRANPKITVGTAIMIWPVAVLIALISLPLYETSFEHLIPCYHFTGRINA